MVFCDAPFSAQQTNPKALLIWLYNTVLAISLLNIARSWEGPEHHFIQRSDERFLAEINTFLDFSHLYVMHDVHAEKPSMSR